MAKNKFSFTKKTTAGMNEASNHEIKNEAASNLPNSVDFPDSTESNFNDIKRESIIAGSVDDNTLINVNDKELDPDIDLTKKEVRGPETIRYEKRNKELIFIDPVFEAIKKAIIDSYKAKLHSIKFIQPNNGQTLFIYQGNVDNIWGIVEDVLSAEYKLIQRNIKITNHILRQILKSEEATRPFVELF